MEDLRGKAAVVTGASRGIGRAIAEALAREGVRVVVSARTRDEIEAVAGGIRRAGGEAVAIPADVTREADIAALVDGARQAYGPIDILVNNAGVGRFAPVWELATADWDWMMATNLRGPFLCIKHVMPEMIARRTGDVVNIGSVLSLTTREEAAAYCATKWGLLALSDTLAREAKPYGIRVSCVCPGMVDTWFNNRHPGLHPTALQAEDVAETVIATLKLPRRATLSRALLMPLFWS